MQEAYAQDAYAQAAMMGMGRNAFAMAGSMGRPPKGGHPMQQWGMPPAGPYGPYAPYHSAEHVRPMGRGLDGAALHGPAGVDPYTGVAPGQLDGISQGLAAGSATDKGTGLLLGAPAEGTKASSLLDGKPSMGD